MYCVSVEFEIKPEHREAFFARVATQREASLSKSACRAFEVRTATERAGNVFLYELYDGGGGFAAHLETVHFRDFDAAIAPMVADRTVRTWDERI